MKEKHKEFFTRVATHVTQHAFLRVSISSLQMLALIHNIFFQEFRNLSVNIRQQEGLIFKKLKLISFPVKFFWINILM